MNKQILGVMGAGALALTSATGAHAAKAKPAPKKAPAKSAKKEVKKPVKKAEPLALSKINLGPLTLEGLLDARLIVTSDNSATVPAGHIAVTGGTTRYLGTGKDSRVLFRTSQASLGATLKTAEKWRLIAQLDVDLEPNNGINPAQNANGDTVGLSAAYMEGKGVLGENGTLMAGILSHTMMCESAGPLGSTDLTLTPGAVGTMLNSLVMEGVAATWEGEGDEVKGSLSVGLFNNLDALNAAATGAGPTTVWTFTDSPGDNRGAGDTDGDIGFWISGTLGDDEDKIVGNLAYFNNGGDARDASAPADTDLWTLGLEAHPGEGWTLKAQYLDGDTETNNVAGTARLSADYKAWYFLGSYQWENTTRLTVRYDNFENDIAGSGAGAAFAVGEEEEGNAWTVALKHDLDGHQQIGLEYLWVDNDPAFGATAATVGRYADAEDNLLQLSYKWFF